MRRVVFSAHGGDVSRRRFLECEIDKHGRVCLSVAGVSYMTTRTRIDVQTIMDKQAFTAAQENSRDYKGSYKVIGGGQYDLRDRDGPSVLQALQSAVRDSKREWTAVEEIVYAVDGCDEISWRQSLTEKVLLAQLSNTQLKKGGVFALRVLNSA